MATIQAPIIKMKTHVLLLSKTFMKGHRKEGQPTNFRKLFLNGTKIHTVRDNYAYWAPRIQEVIDGKAVLSVREWIDKPYKSPGQSQIAMLDATSGLGYQKTLVDELNVCIEKEGRFDCVAIGHRMTFAHNDGLSIKDFQCWFKGKTAIPDHPSILIHFTPFRY